MKHLLALLSAGISIAAGSSLACAADLPLMAAPIASLPQQASWTGPYIGADLGYMFGSTAVTDAGVVTETGAATDGFIAGVLGGYNWQIDDTWVAGIEGDISLASVHGNGTAGPTPPPPSTPNSYDLNWAANIRGRVGFLIMPDTLLYGAGGVAFTDLRFTEGDSGTVDLGVVRTGWTIGAGIEHAFTDQLFGRVEYLYANYGNVSYGPPNDTYVVGFTASTVRAGLSLKF
jgi:outer membrane immunogenic protein